MRNKLLLVVTALGLAACAGKPGALSLEDANAAPVWRYAVRADASGVRRALAVDMNSADEMPLPDGLWCPHGALIDLERDGEGKVVGAVSRAEPVVYDGVGWASDGLTGMLGLRPGPDWIPSFALAPAAGQKQPWIVMRWSKEGQTHWAILERRPEGLRVTHMGLWQTEHLQFQRLERPGPGFENTLILTFQAGEGTHHASVKVEAGPQGSRLRPLTQEDAGTLRHFLLRATAAEKAVVEPVLK